MPLVDYSDGEGDDDDDEQPQAQPQPQPTPQPQPAPAPEQPHAKKQKKEINLQWLLQKHVALPFGRPIACRRIFPTPRAGERRRDLQCAAGRTRLGGALVAAASVKNAPKPGAKAPTGALPEREPLRSPVTDHPAPPATAAARRRFRRPSTSLPLVADDDGDEDDDDNDASGGLLPRQSALPAPSLMPKIMGCTTRRRTMGRSRRTTAASCMRRLSAQRWAYGRGG